MYKTKKMEKNIFDVKPRTTVPGYNLVFDLHLNDDDQQLRNCGRPIAVRLHSFQHLGANSRSGHLRKSFF
jgi:hypothetical protein